MPTSKREVIVCKDSDDIARRAAARFIEIGEESIKNRGRFTVVLSGGSTPKKMYSLLSSEIVQKNMDVKKIHLFWGDERMVPPDSEESNYRMVKESLLDNLTFPEENIHRIFAETGEIAALEYENKISIFFNSIKGDIPVFDLVFLGMGEDGHTASLFPGNSAVNESKKIIVATFVNKLNVVRITLTPPILNAADKIIFLVSGVKKADTLFEVLKGDYKPDMFPAQVISHEDVDTTVEWFVDEAAACKITDTGNKELDNEN